jgi:hypothetical protein
MRNALLSVALLIASCAQDTDGPSSQFELEGKVVDDRSGRGISDAKVSFGSDTLDRADTNTDGEGNFALSVDVREGVEFGTIRATRDGYADGAARTVYFDGTSHVITLRLRED